MANRLTTKEFENNLNDKYGGGYKVLQEYKNAKTKIRIRHEICGSSFESIPMSIMSKKHKGCNYCRIKKQTKTTEWYKEKVLVSCGDEFIVLGEYKTAKDKILMQHSVCGYEWYVTPDNFLRRKSRCPKCSGNARTNTDLFKKRLEDIYGEEYTLLGEYTNARDLTLFRHNICDTEWEVRPELFTRLEAGCPNCKISHGETKVSFILNNLNIKFKREVKFKDCKHNNVLPFDFAIINDNDDILGIIEYDGIQHFEPIEWFGGEKKYNLQIKRDNIKTNYCKYKNIPLLRIPYTLNFGEIKECIYEFYSKEVKQGTTNQK